MSRERTIEKVTATLTSQLLPMDGLREIAVRKQYFRVDLNELLAEKTEEQFVIASYQRILGRRPEQEGISNWLGHLQNGSLTRIEMVRQLVESEEGQARKILVPGLGSSTRSTGSKHKATDTKSEKSRWKLGRRDQKSDSSDKTTALTMDLAIKNVEGQIQELAQQCLHVVEHIEHRFSKFPPLHLTPQSRGQTAFEPTQEKDHGKVRLLHETMLARTNQTSNSQIQLALRELQRMLIENEPTAGTKGWILAGDDVLELVAACFTINIPVMSLLTSTQSIEFARFLGVTAVEQPLEFWLTSCSSHVAPVVWVRDRLGLLSDSQLLTCLAELARVVTENGYLIVEEPIHEASFPFMRMLSAMEVTGFRRDAGEHAQRLTRCYSHSSSSTFVFRKDTECKGCT